MAARSIPHHKTLKHEHAKDETRARTGASRQPETIRRTRQTAEAEADPSSITDHLDLYGCTTGRPTKHI